MPRRQFQSLFSKPRRPRLKRKWRVQYIVWNALKRTAMAVGFMVLFSAIVSALIIANSVKHTTPTIDDEVVLYLPMRDGWIEHKDQTGLNYSMSGKKMTVQRIVTALDKARSDDRVKGLVASYQGGLYNLAHLYEVRAAVQRFKDSGKFAYFYGTEIGSAAGGLGTYYFASVFDEIWLQPMGTVSMTGVNAQMPYLRGMLDKIGVKPEFFARKEYKSVFESISNYESSPESTEMMTAIVTNIASYVVSEIAQARGVTLGEVDAWINHGLFTDDEAENAGLVTHREYVDLLFKKIRKDVTGDPENKDLQFAGVGYYGSVADSNQLMTLHEKPKAALIYTVGTIMHNKEMAGSRLSSAQDIATALMDAADDDSVKIVVLRIDSPGGSPTASETIRRTVERVQEKGKQVIVSMGGTAASGGYWIAAPADRIFATPGTLTGSIGVAGGKIVLAEFWDKIGVNWDGVQYGENADLMSFNESFDEQGVQRFNALMDNIYDGFITRVADGRDMSTEQVEQVARGRVWTGAMASDIGLVDEIGGLSEALDYAATQVGAKDRHGLNVITLPKPKSAIEQLAELLATQVRIGDFLQTHAPALETLDPVLEHMRVQSSGQPAVFEPVSVR